jgi:hypothetical protein
MVNARQNPEVANELRYALDVMEEHSHLGLDAEAAGKLRTILLRRISQAESAESAGATAPVHFPLEEKVTA